MARRNWSPGPNLAADQLLRDKSTSLCGLNPVTSGLEWNVGGRSFRHMTSVHSRSRMTSVREHYCYLAETKALLGKLEEMLT